VDGGEHGAQQKGDEDNDDGCNDLQTQPPAYCSSGALLGIEEAQGGADAVGAGDANDCKCEDDGKQHYNLCELLNALCLLRYVLVVGG
jgi:hypothetical protein